MGKAHVDPTELRRFARDLTRFNEDLGTLTSGLKARLNALEQSWRDQEQRKFSEEFDQTVKVLQRFSLASQDHISFLLKKAAHIEEYLGQR